jgi:hypothetical protein
MTRSPRSTARLRRGRVALAGAIAAIAAMTFGVSSASAAVPGTFSATYDDAALHLSVGTFDVLDPPPPATMTGAIADTDQPSGAFTVPPLSFVFPPFSGEALPGVNVTVALTATDPIVGHVDKTTGVLTTDSSTYHAAVGAFGATCNYNLELAFSTAAGSPFNGDAFTVDSATTAWSITNGIIQANFAPPTPDPLPACNTINTLVASGGALEIGNGFDLTPPEPPAGGGSTTPPPATPTPAPKKKKCKKAKKGSASAAKKCKKKK